MVTSEKTIEHQGIVKHVNDDGVAVQITDSIDCSQCQIKGGCAGAEAKDQIVEIQNTEEPFDVGETVSVILEKAKGVEALFLGYMIPFMILLGTLILGTYFFDNELISGLVALAVLVPYYGSLHLCREKLKDKFTLTIKKHL